MLVAGHEYRLASSETSGGDYWYDYATQLTTTSVASDTSGIFSSDNADWHLSGQPGTRAGQQFVGLDFRYTIQGAFALEPSPHVSPVADLTDPDLTPVYQTIRTRAVTGLSTDQAVLLHFVHFAVPNLPRGVLGETTGLGSAADQTIHLDAQATGSGWSPGARVTSSVYLLTVVKPEREHLPGLPDVALDTRYGGALDTELPVGVRRLPVGSTTPGAEGSQPPALVPGPGGSEGTSVLDSSSDLLGMGPFIQVSFATVTLLLSDSDETCDQDAIAGFSAPATRWALLGHSGFLEFFDVQLLGTRRESVIVPKTSFPGRNVVVASPLP
jgi:hypothetical protein